MCCKFRLNKGLGDGKTYQWYSNAFGKYDIECVYTILCLADGNTGWPLRADGKFPSRSDGKKYVYTYVCMYV